MNRLIILLLLVCSSLEAQKEITLEKIWQEYAFSPNFVRGFNFQNDGQHYTRLENNTIRQYDLLTGEYTKDIFNPSELGKATDFNGRIDSYEFSADESKILIKTETEAIYRRSTKARFFVFNRKSKILRSLSNDKISHASFSPKADKIAFVKKNDLYYLSLDDMKEIRITSDGKYNHIINGSADWVYEEEFAITKTFEWSPDGSSIAFIRFDESDVKQFTMTKHNNEAYPEYVTFKYPKVGEKNAVVSVNIYKLKGSKTTKVDIGAETDIYIPRIKWTTEDNMLCVFRMNRHQNHLELLLANPKNGQTKLLLEEKNNFYIDITDNLKFLKDGDHFVWTSEKDGYNHVYLYDMQGNVTKQLTQGAFDVTSFYGVDEANQLIYYQAAENSPLERHIYKVSLDGTNKVLLTDNKGTNRAQFSTTFDYYVNTHSTINTASTYSVYDNNSKLIRTIEDNKDMAEVQKDHAVQPVEFFNFKTSEDVQLNGYMIKPANFKPNRKYPVFMYLYGGPGSQQVTDSWKGQNYWWFQMLAQNGYIVACVDNRGTGARGEEFRKMTYLQLGKYETIDQIEAAKYLGSLDYTDESRIGIFGWSYGGYMSSLCLLKGNDVFKAAIAVAPVTNWKWYDTIYTERYMRTREENKSGYEDNSPINFVDRLKGNYLLVHGNADDNVHFQNSVEMANALISANKQFDTYFYPNRNHGIYGNNARLHLYTKMTNFLFEKL